MDKDWEALVERVARQMFEGRHKGIIDPAMTKRHAQKLMKAITEGLGYGYEDVLSPKQAQTLVQLQKNVYHFSGAKNWNQLREMSALLTDEEGLAKSFNEFLKGVKAIDATYNQTYLRAEYNHAVASAQMTAKWQQFEEEADALPFLQYVAVMDGRTRDDHRKLHHIVRPVKDVFWKTYYPPNGWNCRCSVLQLDEDDAEGKQHEELPEDLPKVPPMFRNNVGINKEVFDRKHPYFATIPAPVLAGVLKASGEVQKFKPERLEILLLDRTKQFELHTQYGKNGRVFIHRLVDPSSKSFGQELAIAIQKAKEGITVEMLPELHTEEVEFFYHKVFPNLNKKPKTPDFRFNQKDYADLKSPTGKGKNTLKNNIKDAARQCHYAIIHMRQISSWKQAKIDCRLKFKDFKSLHTIEVISGNKRKVYERKKLGL